MEPDTSEAILGVTMLKETLLNVVTLGLRYLVKLLQKKLDKKKKEPPAA